MRTPDSSVRIIRRGRTLAGIAVTMIAGFVVFTGPVAIAATGGVPYTDPSATAAIGLCNRAGHQMTQGNVNTTPFVYHAVSSAPAQAPYNAPGRTATLVAYQPRQDVPAGDWSGDELTASTRYSNPAHPTAAATRNDLSLAGFLQEYPPAWEGLVQLRLFLGAPNQPAYTAAYAATNLKVTGDRWHVVGAVPVDCRSGAAQSIESILLHHASGAPSGRLSHAGHAVKSGHKSAPDASTTRVGTSPAAATSVAAASSGESDHSGVIIGGVIVALVLGTGVTLMIRRRRS